MPDIRNLIKKQKAFYSSIVSIDCSLLNETIYFHSEGFYHLTHKSNGKRRPVSEACLKLMSLTDAPEIIRNAVRILETRKFQRKIDGKIKDVITHTLLDGKKRNHNVVVIIEKVGTGKLKFRSVKVITTKRYNSH